MKKIHLLLLFCLFFAACSDDDKNEESILVTNIVVTDADKVFKPGDAITVSAQGFQDSDQFMVDLRWSLTDAGGLKEGYYIAPPIIKERTATSITFLAPGLCPASTLKMLLIRGEKQMILGQVSLADGQAPQKQQLYGIISSQPMTNRLSGVDQIDLTTGALTQLTRLRQGQDFSTVVSIPRLWSLTGKMKADGKRSTATYDLSMNHWSMFNNDALITFFTNGSKIWSIYQLTDKELTIAGPSVGNTRLNNQPAPTRTFRLPEGMKADALAGSIGVLTSNGKVILSGNNGNGTFLPVVIELHTGSSQIATFDPIKADALIPFWFVVPETNENKVVCGFAVTSKTNPNGTELRLWNTTTNSLEAPFATFPNPARSVATHFSEDMKTQELYVLFDSNQSGGIIEIYDILKKEWRPFQNFGFPYSEILFAR